MANPNQRDGPLTGGPINFPRSPCCAPGLRGESTPNDFQYTNAGPEEAQAFQGGGCGLDGLTVAVLENIFVPAVGDLPTVVSVVVQSSDPPTPAVAVVTLDTTNSQNNDAFLLEFTNNCGCCWVLAGDVLTV